MDTMKQELMNHLVKDGFTFNAENSQDPIVTRPVKLESLVDSILGFMTKQLDATLR